MFSNVSRRLPRLCLSLALAIPSVWLAAASAHAQESTLIDFELHGEPEVLFGDLDYRQGGFIVSSRFDFAVIGYANPDDPVAPVGNSSLYLSVINGASGTVSREDGGTFDLLSIDAAVLPSYPTAIYGGELLFLGVQSEYTTGLIRFSLSASSTGQYPFWTINDLGDIAGFTGAPAFRDLVSLAIGGCAYTSAEQTACDINGMFQIALDNIEVRASLVPEPASAALFGLGLLGLLLSSARRSAHRTSRRHAPTTLV